MHCAFATATADGPESNAAELEQLVNVTCGCLQTALMEMNDSALTIDQLDALSRAVPDDQERKDIRLYLQVCGN